MLHAVRVIKQAEELLLTGHVTFPRPEKDLLLKIRKAELPYLQIAEILEEGMDNVNKAALITKLPEKPNKELVYELIHSVYLDQIKDSEKLK